VDAARPAARRLTAVLPRPRPRRASAASAQPFGVYLVSTDSVFSRDEGESRDVVDVSRWSFAMPFTFGQYQ
jgi:hypothetical protein